MTESGIYCPAGDFYIDPNRAVSHALVTHAHSDHARRGSDQYYCVSSGEGLLKERLGKNIKVKTFEYRDSFFLRGVKISFHPAGHILGSCQIRVEHAGEVWVASGDYKRELDPTCEPFEVVPCDVFISEATFGSPRFQWEKNIDLGKQIFEWWDGNRQRGINSVLLAYSLGKAQRVLGLLNQYAKNPIYCHSAIDKLNAHYLKQGILLAKTKCLSEVDSGQTLKGEFFLVPPSFLKSKEAVFLGENFETAFASGWMAGASKGYGPNYDKGFIMSDHADWNDLIETIQQTQAKKIYVQHRGHGALVKHLNKIGIKAFSDSEMFLKNPNQLSLF